MFDVLFYTFAAIVFVAYALVLIAYPIYAFASFVGRVRRGEPSAIVVAVVLVASVAAVAYATLLFAGLLNGVGGFIHIG